MNIMTLQQQLELIQQNDYTQMQNIDINELTLNMLQHIGTTDSYVRNQLIYDCFSHFIQNEFLSHDQLELLLTTCLSEKYLYFDITSSHTDGVFTRSYTALLIALIIQFDNTHSFLLPETIQETKKQLIEYMNLETDFRGHVKNKGWAHSVAHVSDAFNELVHNPNISCTCYEEITHCLLNKIFIYSTVYHSNEDERIVTPLLSMLYHNFPKEQFFSIIYKKMKRLPQFRKRLSLDEYCTLCANIKTFLRTLFFRAREDPILTSISNLAEKLVRELLKYY
ncbi:DUF2785 domain-containing protein [Bacillus sp. NPDC094106]|uniref:DUF2785 domain-containing protein n=1 Tax=Bacillus sp. NPDC094106 TaxID=3363949 RepID=UPI00381F7871